MMSDDEDFYQNDNLSPFTGYRPNRHEYQKKYSKHTLVNSFHLVNLAALDCYVTIEGTTGPYQKTYQDKLDVNCLVGDMYQKHKSFNLDKIFDEQTSLTNQNSLANQNMPG